MPAFKNIIRAKKVPQATRAALGIEDVRGENRLEVRNEAGKDGEIFLLGSIGKSWWDDSGIDEQEVRDALNEFPKGKKVTVHLNSEGGSVQDGLGIYNAFKDRRDDITCRVAGYALSIASVLPLGAGKVVSPKSAIWMTHCAWSYASGNAKDMEDSARMLREHDETLAEIYASETGKSKAEWQTLMANETWIRGSKAVEFGLADEGDDEDVDDSQAAYRPPVHSAYLSRCKNVGPEILNAFAGKKILDESKLPTRAELAAYAEAYQEIFNERQTEWRKKFSAPSPSGAVNTNQNKEHIMDKVKMLALLKKWDVPVDANASDETILALVEAGKPEKKPAAASTTTADNGDEKIVALTKAIEAQNKRFEAIENSRKTDLKASHKARVNAAVAETKVTIDEGKKILARAEKFIDLGDESEAAEVIDEIESRPTARFGASALGHQSHVQILAENPLEKIYAEKDPNKRHQMVSADWDSLISDAIARDERGDKCRVISPHASKSGRQAGLPMAANTYSATLVTSFLLDGSVTNLQNMWAPLKCFSLGFDQDRYKPLATAVLKNVTVGSTVQTDATNFESGNSTVAPISVTMHQYSASFQVSNSDLNNGLRMADLVTINSAQIANKIIEVVTAPITEANFANYNSGSYVGSPVLFGWSQMALLWGALKKAAFKNAILDGEYIAMLNNLPTFFQESGVGGSAALKFGWNQIECNTDWSGAGSGCRGFACHPQAITRVSGLPLTPTQVGNPIPGATLSEGTIDIPGVGITLAAYTWFSLSSRTFWASYDLMAGAAATDTTAGIFIKAS